MLDHLDLGLLAHTVLDQTCLSSIEVGDLMLCKGLFC